MTGRVVSALTRFKISLAQKGKCKHSQFGANVSHSSKGKILSDSHKKKYLSCKKKFEVFSEYNR